MSRFFSGRLAVMAMVVVMSSLRAVPMQAAAVQTESPKTAPASEFTEQQARQLLDEIRTGLEGNLPRRMLGAFDLTRMNGGENFKRQITAFFNQNTAVRFHFNLVTVSGNSAVVDVQMELDSVSETAPPVRKHERMRFTAASGAKGWKFVDVQPRAFF